MTKKFRICYKSSDGHKEIIYFGDSSQFMIGLDGTIYENYGRTSKTMWESVFDVEATLQQWTGLTDSQGVEIYEGDIVEQVFHSVFSTTYEKDGKLIPVYPIGWRFEVKYRRYKMSPFDLSAENDFKVIGNIFQNPELLEKS